MKKIIRKILMNYLLIKDSVTDVNSDILDLKISVDQAINKLKKSNRLSDIEIDFLENMKKGDNIKNISKKMKISQTRASIIFGTIINKIKNVIGDLT